MMTKNHFIIIGICVSIFKCSNGENSFADWKTYQGDFGRNQYSSLTQVNKQNVNKLAPLWIYKTGDSLRNNSQIQCNPIIINGVLYATTPNLKLIALNAATGKLIWEFDPDLDFSPHVNRGVSYWESKNDKRILYTAGSLLFAINALTGKPV